MARYLYSIYEPILIHFAAQGPTDLQENITFSAGFASKYCSADAVTAHDTLENTYGWTIYDGGEHCPPNTPTTALDLHHLFDSGISDTDNITSKNTPSFNFNCPNTDPYTYASFYLDGTKLDTGISASCTNATSSHRLFDPLPNGTHEIRYTITDSNLESALSPALEITIEALLGDCTNNSEISITDVICAIDFALSGAAPINSNAIDTEPDGDFDIDDVNTIVDTILNQ